MAASPEAWTVHGGSLMSEVDTCDGVILTYDEATAFFAGLTTDGPCGTIVVMSDTPCPVCHMDEHPEDAELEANFRMLDRMGLNPNTGGEEPSWGEVADAQGRVDDLVAETGCIVAVCDLLEA